MGRGQGGATGNNVKDSGNSNSNQHQVMPRDKYCHSTSCVHLRHRQFRRAIRNQMTPNSAVLIKTIQQSGDRTRFYVHHGYTAFVVPSIELLVEEVAAALLQIASPFWLEVPVTFV